MISISSATNSNNSFKQRYWQVNVLNVLKTPRPAIIQWWRKYSIFINEIFFVDNIKTLLKDEFSNIVDHFDDMESFSELVAELENAIGSHSSTVRNIKSGKMI